MLDRRELLKAGALTALGAALPACDPSRLAPAPGVSADAPDFQSKHQQLPSIDFVPLVCKPLHLVQSGLFPDPLIAFWPAAWKA